MMKTAIAILAMVGVVLAGYFGWQQYRAHAEYISEPQQLKRACVAATWDKLVAPSTAKLVDFALVPAAQETILTSKLQANIDSTQKAVDDLKAAEDKAAALTKQSSDQSIKALKKGNDSGAEAAFNISMEAFKNGTDAIIAGIKAKSELDTAKASLTAFRNAGLNEIVLSLDAQNRASAMIRMQSVCTYKPASTPEAEIPTMVVAKLGERGE